MSLDETRKDRRTVERENLRPRRGRDRRERTRRFDSLSPYHDPPSGVKALAVEDPRRLEHIELREQKTDGA